MNNRQLKPFIYWSSILLLALCCMGAVTQVDWVTGIKNKPYVDIREYGAKPGGVFDNTSALNQSCARAAALGNGVVYFPQGNWYFGSSSTCTGTYMSFEGAGVSATILTLGAGVYLINDDVQWITFSFRNIRTTGGAGIIRNTFAGAFSNASKYDVVNFHFMNFTNAAISAESSDEPMWEISNGAMYGDPTVDTTMGIALKGDVSSVLINHITIQNCQVGVKFEGGGRAIVRDVNVTWTTASVGRTRVGLWLVPVVNAASSAFGLSVVNWSGGNEFIEDGDVRVLFADEGTGTYFGDRFWITTVSTGYIGGLSIAGNFAGAGNIETPVVYSYTPNIYASNFGPFVFAGGAPGLVLQYDAIVSPTTDANIGGNTFGPFQLQIFPGQAYQHFGLTNFQGTGELFDLGNEFVLQDYKQQFNAMTSSHVTPLQTWSLPAFSTSGGASFTTITDALGGDQGIEMTYLAGAGGVLAGSTVVPAKGIPVWLEFDLKAGSTSSLANITAVLQTNLGIVMERLITVPIAADGWRTYRLKWSAKDVTSVTALGSLFVNTDGQGAHATAGTVKIGRVKMYQSYEPMSGTHMLGRLAVGSSITNSPVTVAIDGDTGSIDTSSGIGGLKIKDQGNCTMVSGVCPSQTLGHTYGAAPICFGNSNGTGTLTGILKMPSTTTAVVPTSTINTDTAHINWVCLGQ